MFSNPKRLVMLYEVWRLRYENFTYGAVYIVCNHV
jgi:hypothetical protein